MIFFSEQNKTNNNNNKKNSVKWDTFECKKKIKLYSTFIGFDH